MERTDQLKKPRSDDEFEVPEDPDFQPKKKAKVDIVRDLDVEPVFPQMQLGQKCLAEMQAYFLGRLRWIHRTRPDHPMFGPVEVGVKWQAPLTGDDGRNTSWEKTMSLWFKSDQFTSEPRWGHCWMTKTVTMKMSTTRNGNIITLFSGQKTRFLTFLANPTDENWVRVTTEADQYDHACSNGDKTPKNPFGICINVVQHSAGIIPRNANESRKTCTNGALCLCPGHGLPVRCFFMHADGTPKPCRSLPDQVPPCNCAKKCY